MDTVLLILFVIAAGLAFYVKKLREKNESLRQQVTSAEQATEDVRQSLQQQKVSAEQAVEDMRRLKTADVDRVQAELNQVLAKYKPVVDLDAAVEQRNGVLQKVHQQITDLKQDYLNKRAMLESLEIQVGIYENDLNNISYGLYKPVYNFETSWHYKAKLEAIRDNQKQLIKDETAVHCDTEWSVGGSRTEGKRMTKQYSKLMLKAFNGEADALVARVSWNNIGNMEARLYKAYESINKLASSQQSRIIPEYFDLKIAELRLEFELQEKLHSEKEEQRMIREQMREEEKAQREIEQAQRKAEDEEARYQKALLKATEDAKRATGEQLAGLDQKIKELEELLSAAQLQKERAISLAQQTKAGHVYVISNIGSFGEDVFKIGMTRRLEPMDRVRELGDASVPFNFDVHALVYSDNAPDLEYKIHKQLMEKRINLINNRREFFRVDLDEVETIFGEIGHSLSLTKLAEAKEFRETLAIRESQARAIEAPASISRVELPMSLD